VYASFAWAVLLWYLPLLVSASARRGHTAIDLPCDRSGLLHEKISLGTQLDPLVWFEGSNYRRFLQMLAYRMRSSTGRMRFAGAVA
jgi:hypothetical protein